MQIYKSRHVRTNSVPTRCLVFLPRSSSNDADYSIPINKHCYPHHKLLQLDFMNKHSTETSLIRCARDCSIEGIVGKCIPDKAKTLSWFIPSKKVFGIVFKEAPLLLCNIKN